MNHELPDVQAGFRKGRGTRDQIANICWIIEKAREFQKISTSALLTTQSLWVCGSQQTVEDSSRDGNTRPPYLPPENLYAGQEATVRTAHRTMDWLQTGRGVCQGCILSPCLFNLYAEYIMWHARLDEAHTVIKIARRNINNLRYTDDTTLMAESEEELKNLLMKVKEESEKAGLKLNIQKAKIMVSGPITSWQIDEETMETVTDFIFLGSKITEDGNCSHEIKRHLLLGRKAMTNLDSILKSRDIICWWRSICQSYGFSSSDVWMCELDYEESWALRNWCFWTVVLEKTLESPLDYKEIKPVHPKGNQSWIFIGRTDAEAETPILLPPDEKNWPIRKILMLGKIEGRRRGGLQRIRWHQWLDRCKFEQALGAGDGQGSLACYSPWGCKKLENWPGEWRLGDLGQSL